MMTHQRLRPAIHSHLSPARLFAGATSVVVLHILVDAFITLEPGVTRSDHLVPVLGPVVIIALAVALFPRVRTGWQALLSFTMAVWVLTGAGVAAFTILTGTPRADDWTGLLLLFPAGVLLSGLALTRVLHDHRHGARAPSWRVLRLFGTLLFIWFVVYPVAFAIVVAHKPRAPVVQADWGRPSEEVRLLTSDGLSLAATYVPTENGAAVILFPRQFAPVAHAQMLARHGYGVLLVDMRGQGESEGDPNGFGWGSTKDLDAAVAFLQQRDEVVRGRIGGLGLSVGGEQMIEAAAGNRRLQAIAVEGVGFHSAHEGFSRRGPHPAQLALQAVQDWILTGAIAVLSGDRPPPSLAQSAARIAPRPVFFLLGERDNDNPRMLVPAYYDAAGTAGALWVIPGATHTMGIQAQPAAYEERVIGFFDDALLDRAVDE